VAAATAATGEGPGLDYSKEAIVLGMKGAGISALAQGLQRQAQRPVSGGGRAASPRDARTRKEEASYAPVYGHPPSRGGLDG
jgi:UDP-N-acetylmuramate-alanine ligase